MSGLPQRRGEVWVARDRDQVAVYVAETDSLHLLNATALAIWELCDGDTTPDEMADAIAELTGMPVAEARADVDATLASLGTASLVEEISEPGEA